MEKHTTAFNNVHTQLLLEIQVKSNIQEIKDQVLSTQNELHATKAKLATKQERVLMTEEKLSSKKKDLHATTNNCKSS